MNSSHSPVKCVSNLLIHMLPFVTIGHHTSGSQRYTIDVYKMVCLEVCYVKPFDKLFHFLTSKGL